MTNLTDKLRKGELLPEGLYWVKHDGVINILDNLEISLTNVDEILGEVPSYEQWQDLKEYEQIVASYNMKPIDYDLSCRVVTRLLGEKKELRQENTKLKELLKECKERLIYCTISTHDVQAKINQALGEE